MRAEMMSPKLIYYSNSNWMFPMTLDRIRFSSGRDRHYQPLTGRSDRSTIDSLMEMEKKEMWVPAESFINSMGAPCYE